MFPRPSRFLRLVFFLLFVILVTISMYVLNLDPSISTSSSMEFKPMFRMSTLKATPSHVEAKEIRVSASRRENVPKLQMTSNTDMFDSDVEFDKSVAKRLGQSHLLSVNHDTEPPVDIRVTTKQDVNPHSFAYIHNPSSICHSNHVKFLVYIHSSPVNLKKRQAVRQTWAHPKLLRLYNATLVFILGGVEDRSVQELVDMEAAQYGDIVQEDFLDSYRNLTHKGVAGLKWAAIYCPTADFLLKTDDDILVDIVSFMENLYTQVLPARKSWTKLVLCNVWTRMKVIRDSKSKWYISKEEFPEEYFPAYCSGSAFLLSADMAPALYKTSLQTPFFWVDDYYVTGMLVNKLQIKHTRFNPAYLLNPNVAEEKLQNDTKELLIFHVKKMSLFLKLWPVLKQRHKGMEQYLEPIAFTISRSKANTTSETSNTSDGQVLYTGNSGYNGSDNVIPRSKNNSRKSLLLSRKHRLTQRGN